MTFSTAIWRARAGLLAALAAITWPEPAPAQSGDAERGFELAREHCSHCHVIGDYNRMGGIGSTPSFQWMVRDPDYAEIFRTFYVRRPHPVFVRVPGVPRWSDAPPYYPEFHVTLDDVEDIVAYVATLKE
jgi:mono/diheme cytochrome c family protein